MTNLSEANLNNGAAVGPQGEGMDSPSSFPAYPTYKDSGVEWLGVVPENWALGSLKHLAWIRNGRDYKEVESPDGEYPVIGSGGQFANATRYLYDGESVLLGRKGTIDKPLYIHGRFWTVDTMFYTEVTAGASAKFLYYNALTIPFQYYSTSTALPSMTQGDLLNHPCAIPALEEQTQIARFLDHETARIDALIEEQQRLIELLKEKRQAVISHAVTKGLDPTVPMKDSGVEWLGEVPAHWGVKSMKHLVEDGESVSYGIVQPGDHQDEGVPFIQTTNMSSGDFSFDALQRTSSEIEANYPRSRLHGGEVILGIRATIGAAFVVPESLKNINLSRGVARIACSEQVLAGYLVYFLSGRAAFEYWGLAKQGSTFSEVSIATVRELPVTVPPLIEQQELIEHMEQGIKSLDELTLIAERTMALLRERRSALISAAVTGKIDVRGWQPPASAPTPELVEEAV
jgi:type I restriction enzyme S subunit